MSHNRHIHADPGSPRDTVLLTGATGYVGGRLLARLQSERRHRIRCLSRHPEALAARTSVDTEIVAGDVLEPESLVPALADVQTAYYLVHSMSSRGDYSALDRTAARNFAAAAREAGVRRIVYLGGLGDGRDLSRHLASRQEVGQILRCSGVPTVEFRASIVIGPGSASYEIVRALVEQLPVTIAPRWVDTAAQPIAIEDVVAYLIAALDHPDDAIFEIGGDHRHTYAEVIREYARQRGLRRRLLRSSLLTPRISRVGLAILAPSYRRVAGAMVDSLRNETVVCSSAAQETFAVKPLALDAAIARALVNEDREFATTRWCDALPRRRAKRVSVGRRLVSSSVTHVPQPPARAFHHIRRIGGRTGWYAADHFWRLRGALDRLRGGVGFRRGRRNPVDLCVGDAVDFWRVDRLEEGRVLRLAAELKLPGRLWLQFEVEPDGADGARIRQTTVFDPAGYVGLAYWYLLSPVHHLVFGRVLRGIARAVRATDGGSRRRPG